MRRRARKDANHGDIVRDLISIGFSVLETHQLGCGAPDLVVGFRGITALVELKPAGKDFRAHETQAVKRERLAKQRAYLEGWRGGPAFVASSTEDIVDRLCEEARMATL